jgi:hypothetical protein
VTHISAVPEFQYVSSLNGTCASPVQRRALST